MVLRSILNSRVFFSYVRKIIRLMNININKKGNFLLLIYIQVYYIPHYITFKIKPFSFEVKRKYAFGNFLLRNFLKTDLLL